MKTAFATLGCPGWPLTQVISEAKRMGYDGVELRISADEPVNPDLSAAGRAEVKQQFADAGITIASMMGYTNYVQAERTGSDLEADKQLIELAADIGCRTVRIFGGRLQDVPRELGTARFIASLQELAPIAEAAGCTLALETHDDWCKGSDLQPLLDAVPGPGFSICWDACNGYFDEPPETTFAVIRQRLGHVHFKDAVVLENGRHGGKLPGEGDVDLARIYALLASINYDGFVSFEWEKKWQPDLAGPEVALPHFIAYFRSL